jgi:hypothetical protein
MAAQSFSPTFDGYWREPNISGIPAQSGVYCVYACTYDASARTVSIRFLIYIGEGENVNDRVANHEKWDDWRRHLRRGEELCFSFSPVDGPSRQRVEAALIFRHKPPENDEYTSAFPFDTTMVSSAGKTALLVSPFTVYRTE